MVNYKREKLIFLLFLGLLLIFNFLFIYSYASEMQDIEEIADELSDTINIASEPDYPPYCIIDEEGNADGFSVELFKEAAAAVGLDVRIKTGIWSQIKEDLAEGRIDALPLVGRTPEREELFDFTIPYLSLHGAVFVRAGTKVHCGFER